MFHLENMEQLEYILLCNTLVQIMFALVVTPDLHHCNVRAVFSRVFIERCWQMNHMLYTCSHDVQI